MYDAQSLQQRAWGTISGIGFETASFSGVDEASGEATSRDLPASDLQSAIAAMSEWLNTKTNGTAVAAIGHRIVHGGPVFSESVVITPQVAEKLIELTPFAPVHLPSEIELIEAMQRTFPSVPQIACFDTAFHAGLPSVARQLPIPRRFQAKGVRRYGFHGLSYSYLMEELEKTAGDAAKGKVILAHLGNGVSLAAVSDGRSVDTSMGLTPASGAPMSTRSGDLDPGLLAYLAAAEGFTIERFTKMTAFESGLLGISETTSDMKKLLDIEQADERAAEAIALFCYQVKKHIGAYSAALGGLETLVFSGGMGEVAPKIRARVCEGLEFLGISLDSSRNEGSEAIISTDDSRVTVRVIHTDESLAMIKDIVRIMKQD